MNRDRFSKPLWECVGTYIFLTSLLWLIARADSRLLTAAAAAFALAFTASVVSRAYGHFNPAVTGGHVVAERFSMVNALLGVGAQIVGACAAVFTVVLVEARTLRFTRSQAEAYILQPAAGVPMWQAAFFEGFGTFLLTCCVLGLGASQSKWAPWMIGGSLGAAVYAFGAITGGGFNPALAIAPYILAGTTEGLVYMLVAHVLGPVVGAVLAGLLFAEYRKKPVMSS